MNSLCPNKCRNESVAIARSFQLVCDSDFEDKKYNKHVALREASILSQNAIKEIEHYVMTTPKRMFRPIDVHRFDIKQSN